eukprot:TRINITY_DN5744_c0_g1_i1.p1 TRINITY_DN5744_c0_g1~~TRINITY_DN5744_c0_g1_i1.p1  ORF type:complete len:613 (+),score=114.60 TRINITY_DN5744_c0_g1_i1:120-1958(+)
MDVVDISGGDGRSAEIAKDKTQEAKRPLPAVSSPLSSPPKQEDEEAVADLKKEEEEEEMVRLRSDDEEDARYWQPQSQQPLPQGDNYIQYIHTRPPDPHMHLNATSDPIRRSGTSHYDSAMASDSMEMNDFAADQGSPYVYPHSDSVARAHPHHAFSEMLPYANFQQQQQMIQQQHQHQHQYQNHPSHYHIMPPPYFMRGQSFYPMYPQPPSATEARNESYPRMGFDATGVAKGAMGNGETMFPGRVRNAAGTVTAYFSQEEPLHDENSRFMLVDGDRPENTYYFTSLSDAIAEIKPNLTLHADSEDAIKPFWLDIHDITADDVRLLESEFKVHTLTAEDILEKDTREKTESFDKYRCVILHESYFDFSFHEALPFILLIFKSYIITIRSKRTVISLEALKSIREARSGMPQPDWVMYAIIDALTDAFIPLVNSAVTDTNSLDQLCLTLSADDHTDFLSRIRIVRSKIARLRTTLSVKREIMNQLMSRAYTAFVQTSTKVYLRDVADELDQLLQKLEAISAALNNFPSTFLARMSVSESNTALQLGDLMKKFSAITLVFLPMTLVAGLFGMNVKIPGNAEDEPNNIMFGTICGALGLFGVLVTVILWRIRWL